MSDNLSNQERSALMAKVRSHGNMATELRLVALFQHFKIKGWRRNQKLPGKPDFVFRPARVALFVDGCFWHGCPKCYRRPDSNRPYWDKKVQRNRTRDQLVNRMLRKNGWRVLRVWEHELRGVNTNRCIKRLRRLFDAKCPDISGVYPV